MREELKKEIAELTDEQLLELVKLISASPCPPAP